MKIKCLTSEVKDDKKKKWHKWYAWFPVRVDSCGYRWLEWIERKGTCTQTHYQEASLTPGTWKYKYRISWEHEYGLIKIKK